MKVLIVLLNLFIGFFLPFLRDLKAKFDVDLRDIISFKVEGDLVKIKCFGIEDIILNLSSLNRRFLTDFLNLILSKGDLERFIVELDNLPLHIVDKDFTVVFRGAVISILNSRAYFMGYESPEGKLFGVYDTIGTGMLMYSSTSMPSSEGEIVDIP
ncbi:MAG: hypothetical protein NDF54_10865 [archaeon GB-1867-035]|nr:hypothetical protein [Candidatus Culexmicrobium profundum]